MSLPIEYPITISHHIIQTDCDGVLILYSGNSNGERQKELSIFYK